MNVRLTQDAKEGKDPTSTHAKTMSCLREMASVERDRLVIRNLTDFGQNLGGGLWPNRLWPNLVF